MSDTPTPTPLRMPLPAPPTTRHWVDAYTMQLEAMAEAVASPRLRKAAEDALRRAQADLATETNPVKAAELRSIVANQQKVLLDIGTFDVDAYRNLISAWRSARAQILAAGWDLTQEIRFDATTPGVVQVYAEGSQPQPFTAMEAQVVIAFAQFVDANQERFDPTSYTKQMLERQGINKDNFDDHADRLCIDNPWRPPAAPRIIQGNFK